MSELQRITIEPDRCGGRPCIRGLRIRVSDILELLDGFSWTSYATYSGKMEAGMGWKAGRSGDTRSSSPEQAVCSPNPWRSGT